MEVTLHIPTDATFHISEGQKVKIGDPFYSIKKSQEVAIPVTRPLGVKPQLIFQYARVVIGAEIKPGDTLASAKKFIGTKNIRSDIGGSVIRIDHEEGIIIVNTSSDQDRMQTCFFTGTITKIDQKKSLVTIDVGAGIHVNALTIDGDGGGEVTITSPDNYFSLSADDISGNAVLIHDLPSHIFTKLDALDAGGVIYVSGDITSTVPSAQTDEKSFELLSKKPHAFIVFSSHEKKIFAYN